MDKHVYKKTKPHPYMHLTVQNLPQKRQQSAMHAIHWIGNEHINNIPAFEIRDIPPRCEIQ